MGFNPSKTQLVHKAVRAARDVNDDMSLEHIAEIQEDSKESSDIDEEAGLEENTSDNDEDSQYESLPKEEDNGLADWAAAARITEDDRYQSSETEYAERYSTSVQIVESDSYMPALRMFRADESSIEQVAFRHRATKDLRTEDGPIRNFKNPGVMEGFIRIGEIKAHVLLDCGSMLDMVSANYTATSKLDMFPLKKPVRLQMATSGSHTTIQFGARAEIQIGKFRQKRYFDVVNLDRYD